ncbi:MAG: hypothetical protein K0Q55_792, partial [Verrucomicrobia bacterium]|nr:hypothetical protein [Verrucomicrobiota bacterium]
MNVRKFVQKLGKGGLFIFAAIALLIFWARWIPFDKSWQKPAHVIQNFLVPAQKGDYSQAKIFFAEK